MFLQAGLNLSPLQKRKIAIAAMNERPMTVGLGVKNYNGSDILYLTKTQHNRLMKNMSEGKGMRINLSKKQLQHNKKQTGGFIWALLPALGTALATGAASSAGSWLFDKITGKKGNGLYNFGPTKGNGLYNFGPPKGNGLYNFGKGFMSPNGHSMDKILQLPNHPVGAIATMPIQRPVKKGGKCAVTPKSTPESINKCLKLENKMMHGGCGNCEKKKVVDLGQGLFLHGPTPKKQ